jgi:signal transduction histidine kinase
MCGTGPLPTLGAVPRVTDLYRHLRARRGYLLDAALALLLVLINLPRGTPATAHAPEWAVRAAIGAWATFSMVMAVGMIVRHRWPLLALGLASLGATGHAVVRGPRVGFPMLIDLAVPITLYTLASRGRSRRFPLAALAVLVCADIALGALAPFSLLNGNRGVASAMVHPKSPVEGGSPKADVSWLSTLRYKLVEPELTASLALALAYALGQGARSRRAHLRTLQQRAADAERDQRQRIALAIATERARIGRDLHDVTTHSLAVMVAQAQAALAAQHRHPERTTQAIREVIAVGRDSLSEMRRLVGAFGPAPDAAHGLDPPAGIAALPALVDRIQAAGVPVRFTLNGAPAGGPARFTGDGTPVGLPAGVDLSAYRIVQEALTNTLKHAAPGARADVRLTIRSEYVDVEVTDDGAGRSADAPAERGNGLRGMAERVHLLGGTLTAGPGPDSGFAVRARLPLSPRSRTPADTAGAPS